MPAFNQIILKESQILNFEGFLIHQGTHKLLSI